MSISAKVQISKMLREWRQVQAATENVELYRILQNKTISEIADTLPETNIDLLAIKGLGPKKVQKYGQQLLEIVLKAQLPEPQNNLSTSDDDGTISVAEFISRLNFSLAKHTVRIRGEISDRVKVVNRAIYFRIKDSEGDAILDCFAWRDTFEGKGTFPEEGAEVVLEGQTQIYPPTGRFSLQVKALELHGEGLLKKAFDKLHQELDASGAFKPERKRGINQLPRRIALVTALKSDAETDFITHVGQYGFQIDKYDVRVEGVRSESSLLEALQTINSGTINYDAIVVTRGGGSLESLQSFNTKSLVKAIMASRYPVISAVGHERDVTLCDLVADVRVSTPTDAGKFFQNRYQTFDNNINNQYRKITNLAPQFLGQVNNNIDNALSSIARQLEGYLIKLKQVHFQGLKQLQIQMFQLRSILGSGNRTLYKISGYFNQILYQSNTQLTQITRLLYRQARSFNTDQRLISANNNTNQQREIIKHILQDNRQRIIRSQNSCQNSLNYNFKNWINNLEYSKKLLDSFNPEAVLTRGYAILSADSKTIRTTDQAKKHSHLTATLIDGKLILRHDDQKGRQKN
jgi:exodeoxyribonuclease VII large subunit